MSNSTQNQAVDTDVAPLIGDILGLLSAISDKFEPGENEMRQWMEQHFQNPEMLDLLQEMTLTMMRVLDVIGEFEPVNGITISKKSRVPKGSVSKITRRLMAHKLITQEALPNNKKEVLFRTTPLGKAFFQAHRAFDQGMERKFRAFMRRYSADELRFLARVLQEALDAPWMEMPPDVK